jgi:hypothetical protein
MIHVTEHDVIFLIELSSVCMYFILLDLKRGIDQYDSHLLCLDAMNKLGVPLAPELPRKLTTRHGINKFTGQRTVGSILDLVCHQQKTKSIAATQAQGKYVPVLQLQSPTPRPSTAAPQPQQHRQMPAHSLSSPIYSKEIKPCTLLDEERKGFKSHPGCSATATTLSSSKWIFLTRKFAAALDAPYAPQGVGFISVMLPSTELTRMNFGSADLSSRADMPW